MNHKKVYCREVGNFQISRAPLLSVWNDMRAYLYHSATRKRFEINPSARMGDEFERILSKSSPSRKADNLEVLSQSFLICQKMTSRNLLHHFRVHFLRNKQVQGVVCLGSNKKTSMKLQASDVFIGWASCLKAWKTCIENDFSFRNFEAFSVSSKMAAWAFAKPRLAPVTKSFGKHFRMKNLCWLHFTCIGKIGNALISPWQSWYGLLNNQSIHPSSIAFNCVSCCTSVILGETRSFVDLEHEDRSADESSTSRRGFKDFKFIAAISQISLDFCFSEQIIPARIKKKKLFDSGRQQLDQGHFGHFSLGDPLSTLPLRRPGKSFFFGFCHIFSSRRQFQVFQLWHEIPWNSHEIPFFAFCLQRGCQIDESSTAESIGQACLVFWNFCLHIPSLDVYLYWSVRVGIATFNSVLKGSCSAKQCLLPSSNSVSHRCIIVIRKPFASCRSIRHRVLYKKVPMMIRWFWCTSHPDGREPVQRSVCKVLGMLWQRPAKITFGQPFLKRADGAGWSFVASCHERIAGGHGVQWW